MNPPDFEELDNYPGDDFVERWANYGDALYQIFLDTLVHGGLTFRGRPISVQRRPETLGKAYGFWHLLQEGSVEEERTPDLERCRRLPWVRAVIEAANEGDPEVRVFQQNPRDGKPSWVLWAYDRDYVVILSERAEYFLLKTAFAKLSSGRVRQFTADWNRANPAPEYP